MFSKVRRLALFYACFSRSSLLVYAVSLCYELPASPGWQRNYGLVR